MSTHFEEVVHAQIREPLRVKGRVHLTDITQSALHVAPRGLLLMRRRVSGGGSGFGHGRLAVIGRAGRGFGRLSFLLDDRLSFIFSFCFLILSIVE